MSKTRGELEAERAKAVAGRRRDMYAGSPLDTARESKSRDDALSSWDGYIEYLDAELAKL